MKKEEFTRRDFGKLSLAAFGGLLAGSVLSSSKLFADEAKKEMHACCGLNSCKGQGASGENSCAGMGNCATVASHECSGHNDCKNQGGSAENECKGHGTCSVPAKGDAWKKARANFEARMKKDGKEVGKAPDTCGK